MQRPATQTSLSTCSAVHSGVQRHRSLWAACFSMLLLSPWMAAAFGQATAPDERLGESATIYLQNGDHAFGHFGVSPEAEFVQWVSPMFQQPIRFDLRGVKQIVFGGEPESTAETPAPDLASSVPAPVDLVRGFFQAVKEFQPPKPAAATAAPAEEGPKKLTQIRLLGDQSVSGRVTALDAQHIQVESPRHGSITLLRSAVLEIDGLAQDSSLIFAGINQFGQWTTINEANYRRQLNGRTTAPWEQGPAVWTTIVRGANRYFDARGYDRISLDVDLSGAHMPEFQVTLGCGQDSNSVAEGFSLEVWDRNLVIHRQVGEKFFYQKLNIPQLKATDWNLRVKLFADFTAHKLMVIHDDQVVGELQTESPSRADLRGVVIRNRGQELKVHGVELRRWSGPVTATIAAAQQEDVAVLVDGSQRIGSVDSIDSTAGKMQMAVKQQVNPDGQVQAADAATQQLELAQVDRLIFRSRDAQQLAPLRDAIKQANTKVEYRDGITLSGQYLGTRKEGLELKVPFATGTVLIGWADLGHITFQNLPEREMDPQKKGLTASEGTRLHGRIVNGATAVALNWEPEYSDLPLPFASTWGTQINFDPVPTGLGIEGSTDRVALVTGDTLPCELVTLDDKDVMVRWADGRQTTIPRKLFKMWSQPTDDHWLYAGLQKGDKWTTSPRSKESLSFEDGTIVFRDGVKLARELELPQLVKISLDVQWHAEGAQLVIGFGADTAENSVWVMQNQGWTQEMLEKLSKERPDYVGELMLYRQGTALMAMGSTKAAGMMGQFVQRNFAGMQNGQQSPLPLGETNYAHIDLLIDGARHEYTVLANGKELTRWRDPTRIEGKYIYFGLPNKDQSNLVMSQNINAANGTDSGSGAQARDKRLIEVSNFRVARWSGQFPAENRDRFLTRRLGSLPNAVTEVLRASNGDSLRGKLIRVEGDTVIFEARRDKLTIPRGMVAEAINLQPISEPAAPPPNELIAHVRLRSGEPVALRQPHTSEQYLTGRIDEVGDVVIPWPLIGAIKFGPNSDRNDLLAAWKLIEPKPLPTPEDEAGAPSPWIGKPVPDMAVQMIGGSRKKLSEYQGQVVVLDFWATWCGPCLAALPGVMEVTAQYPEQVQLIAMNQQEDPADIQEFLNGRNWELPVALDEDGAIGQLMQVEAIPCTFVIDRTGTIRHVHVGAAADLKDQLKTEIDALLAPPAE